MTSEHSDEHPEPTPVASFATEGEAEVAQAKLRAFGVESALDDQVEGGIVPIEGEDGVIVEVRAEDAEDALAILSPDPDGPDLESGVATDELPAESDD